MKENQILITMYKINAQVYITMLNDFIRVTTLALHYCEFEYIAQFPSNY